MKLGWSVPARLVRWIAGTAGNAAGFYVLTGRQDQPWVWAVLTLGSLWLLALLLVIDADLARERRRPGPGGIDRSARWVVAPLTGAAVVVACLDIGRFHWSDSVPPVVHALGFALNGIGFSLITWAIAVNRFFSSVVRVQSDRGHQLITSGPYGVIRHPGYLGMLLVYPTISLTLGSWWGLVPGAACALVLLRRASLEDRYLQENLAGYRDYTALVPYRLIPGVW